MKVVREMVGATDRAKRDSHMRNIISLKYNYYQKDCCWVSREVFLYTNRLNGESKSTIKAMESDRCDQNGQKQDHRIKYQSIQPKKGKLERRLRRKTNCPTHAQKLLLKCAEQGCKQPYMCLHAECIECHFHSPILKVTKIDIAAFQQKLERAQIAMANSQKLFGEAFQIKAIIDSLKNSVSTLFKDVGSMGRTFSDLKAEVDSTLSIAFLGKVDEALKIQSRISASIERIKSKINLVPLQPQPQPLIPPQQMQNNDDFFMKAEISSFLQANISNFDWKTLTKLINTKQKEYTCEQFHQTLKGKQNLVFLFIAESRVVGSYFSCPYPSIGDAAYGKAKDGASFIFIAKQDPNIKILKFLANSDANHHIQISKQCYIAHGHLEDDGEGLMIMSEAIDSLDVGLPTQSYVAENTEGEDVNQNVKLLEIVVFQISGGIE